MVDRYWLSVNHFTVRSANARRTFPGSPPKRGYPELTNTIPPPTIGPAPSIEPPRAATPLTVVKVLAVSKSQSKCPSTADCGVHGFTWAQAARAGFRRI